MGDHAASFPGDADLPIATNVSDAIIAITAMVPSTSLLDTDYFIHLIGRNGLQKYTTLSVPRFPVACVSQKV